MAVNAAQDGDAINVEAGTYFENVFINKSINLLGGGREETVIDGGAIGDVIYVSANHVNISELSITNSGKTYLNSGIKLIESNSSSIYNCDFRNNFNGVTFINSFNNIISDSAILKNNYDGVCLISSDENQLHRNVISNNFNHGIHIQSSSNNIIENNSCKISISNAVFKDFPKSNVSQNGNEIQESLILPVSEFNSQNFTPSLIPASFSFGFTIVDDPDNARLEYIKPIYDYLAQIGMKTTPLVWVRESDGHWGSKGDTTNRSEYRDYFLSLQNIGFEIGLHSPSGDDDSREKMIWGFERFKEIFGYYPNNYVQHSDNKENFWGGNQSHGHIPNSPYYCTDILKEKGCNIGVNILTGVLNIFSHTKDLRHSFRSLPSYYRHYFPNCHNFLEDVTEERLQKLVDQRGISIISTHFASEYCDFFYNGSWEQAKYSSDAWVRQGTIGWNTSLTYRLNITVKKRLDYISSLGGWYVPTRTIFERWDAIKEINISNNDEVLEIKNPTNDNIEDMALECNNKSINILLDLQTYKTVVRDNNGMFRIGDLMNKSSKRFLVLIKNNDTRNFSGYKGFEGMDLTIDDHEINIEPGYSIGIYLIESHFNIISGNKFINNLCGILLQSGSFNKLYFNEITDNREFGFICGLSSSNNQVYYNNFIGNNISQGSQGLPCHQAIDLGNFNHWSASTKGNYWYDWTAPDVNSDDITDEPYIIEGDGKSQDNFPLVKPIEEYPPTANAGQDITVILHHTILFNGSYSWGYSAIINYTWSFTDGNRDINLYGCRPSYIFDIPKNYTITLKVTDVFDRSAADTMILTVRETTSSKGEGAFLLLYAIGIIALWLIIPFIMILNIALGKGDAKKDDEILKGEFDIFDKNGTVIKVEEVFVIVEEYIGEM